MKDERIIKANHCCIEDGNCERCPYFIAGDEAECRKMREDTLGLIYRYKAENNRLKQLLQKKGSSDTVVGFAEKLKKEIFLLLTELYNQRNDRIAEIKDADFVYIDLQLQVKAKEIALLERVVKMIDDVIEKEDGAEK